ncbi:MAG TPA: DUF5777 family beta-barrel protein [Pyrinomonadaceae bacterium]|jgi:hypothetical protein
MTKDNFIDAARAGSLKFLLTAAVLLGGFFADAQGQTPSAETGSTAAPEKTEAVTPAPTTAVKSQMKVTFDEAAPGVIYIESNGEKIRIDANKKTVAQVTPPDEKLAETPARETTAKVENPADEKRAEVKEVKAEVKKDDDDNESLYDFDEGEEPYDYKIINVPTPKKVPKGTWNLFFSHRFTQPIHPLDESGKNLLGLDSFSVSSFGVTYGITDKLYVSASRSPLCVKGLCRTIEIGFGYNWLAQDKDSPVALTTYASVEGNDNFTEEYTYNLQAMLSGRIGKRIYLFFSPAVHLNSNGQHRFNPRPTDFFPPATAASSFELPTNGATFGFGTSVLITHSIAALFDFAPRIGFKLGRVRPIFGPNFQITGFTNESHPSMGLGIQKNIGRHSFTLTFSNTQTSTTSKYNSSNLLLKPRRLTIGFNLSRRF